MNDTEVKELIEKLDKRYITKEDLFRLTDGRYATRDELVELRGKVEAIREMQAKSNTLLESIHTATIKIREENARQIEKLEETEKEIKAIKKSTLDKIWYSDKPSGYLLRFIIALGAIFIALFIYSSILGHELMDEFMEKNGVGVAIFSTISGAVFSWIMKTKIK